MIFCNKHRLPENHVCPFDLRKKKQDIISAEDSYLLYEDALEFMNGELTVAKIYNYVSTKSINKSEATELLNYFIENSDDSEIRNISILAFKVLGFKNSRVFNILENCLLSDQNQDVKKAAIEVLTYNFPEKSQKLLNWFYKHK